MASFFDFLPYPAPTPSRPGGHLGNSVARIPSGIGRALDWTGTNVAAPALGQMADLYQQNWRMMPFGRGMPIVP